TSCHSLPAPMVRGSTAKFCAPMEALPEQNFIYKERTNHEERHCHHRRIQWLRRLGCTCSGSCRSHRLREHARDYWPECATGQRSGTIRDRARRGSACNRTGCFVAEIL